MFIKQRIKKHTLKKLMHVIYENITRDEAVGLCIKLIDLRYTVTDIKVTKKTDSDKIDCIMEYHN